MVILRRWLNSNILMILPAMAIISLLAHCSLILYQDAPSYLLTSTFRELKPVHSLNSLFSYRSYSSRAHTVVKEIHSRMERYFHNIKTTGRAEDVLVHCCFFFVAPHR